MRNYVVSTEYNSLTVSGELDFTEELNKKISFRIGISRIVVIGGGNYYFLNAWNSEDGDCGSSLFDVNKTNEINEKLTNASIYFERFQWKDSDKKGKIVDYNIGGFISKHKFKLPVQRAAKFLGFDSSGYYNTAELINLNNHAESTVNYQFESINGVKSLKCSGNLDIVNNLTNRICENGTISQTVISAALASVIVGWLKLDSYVFSIIGKPGCGKSTLLNLCLSFFSNSNDKEISFSFNGTEKRIKDSLNGKHGVLVAIDDTATSDKGANNINFKRSLKSLIYHVAENKGRRRVNDEAVKEEQMNFNTVCMITGEESIVNDDSILETGARRRIVELSVDSFSEGYTKDEKQADEIKTIIEDNYGLFAPAFVKFICRKYSDIAKLKSDFSIICESVQCALPDNGTAKGYGKNISSIIFAAEILKEMGIHVEPSAIKESLISDFLVSDVSLKPLREKQCVDVNKLYTITAIVSYSRHRNLIDENNGEFMYVFPEDEKEICRLYGCNSRTFRKTLFESGLTEKDKGNHMAKNTSFGTAVMVSSVNIFETNENNCFVNSVMNQQLFDMYNKNCLDISVRPELSWKLKNKLDVKLLNVKRTFAENDTIVRITDLSGAKSDNNFIDIKYENFFGDRKVMNKLIKLGYPIEQTDFYKLREYISEIAKYHKNFIETISDYNETWVYDITKKMMDCIEHQMIPDHKEKFDAWRNFDYYTSKSFDETEAIILYENASEYFNVPESNFLLVNKLLLLQFCRTENGVKEYLKAMDVAGAICKPTPTTYDFEFSNFPFYYNHVIFAFRGTVIKKLLEQN